jgi:hypothetical protein
MSDALAAPPIDAATVERVLLHGDLSKLTPPQKIAYYQRVCDSVGLNPLTQPFQYLVLNGREVLYARREATEQLRKIHQVSIEIRGREVVEECYVVTARATLPTGRTDENIGVVPLGAVRGEARANAMMKAETKAKRRATLSICGLGMLDETEVESLPPAATATPATPAADVVEPAEAPTLAPRDAVTITGVDKQPTRNKAVSRYSITLSTGAIVTTVNEWLASLATDAQQNQWPMFIKTRESKFGVDLVGMQRADEEITAIEPPPDEEDLPF